ncbi:ATP-binding cassette domain-containing protein [Candidatus Pelagibacter sp.]|mgnify:FL=1|jgi:branched-chain amino acid transport system ATP-binding protein|nr:ATP-binding cassette domain-containing protein [Candidatus Pelagibacter sp.]MDB3942035.1 ATP-binding cassette domain-containing protein [Candidatus Pelagibacter sp.]MDC3334156.1 ATP-binding cassette domain-containing protein [Candidatus Pelagibacter sp.]|tara:strand:+ start:2122 stop:2820 length:699 start_codon:yes stop_codon:yes gene_type:complete
MATILETKSVTKKFGGFTAVDNVSLKVDSGEIRFVIGPNGAGKSTLFKLVIGFHSPNSGTILYKDKNIEKLKLHERINLGMGVKFQAPSVFSELTVLENLFLANNREHSIKVSDLLNDFALENEKNSLAGDLSHGKKQWLDIALSTISKPDLVFLDEPTAGLSVDETRITGEIVKNLNKQGITFIVVGHDMDFVKQTASKVSLLHLGKMFIEGSVDEVLSDKGVNDIYLGLS